MTAFLSKGDLGQVGKLLILEVHAIEASKKSAANSKDMSVVASLLR